jgi:hypothetical protein
MKMKRYIINQKYRLGCRSLYTFVTKTFPKNKEQIIEETAPTIILDIVNSNVRSSQNIRDNMNKVTYLILLSYYN